MIVVFGEAFSGESVPQIIVLGIMVELNGNASTLCTGRDVP